MCVIDLARACVRVACNKKIELIKWIASMCRRALLTLGEPTKELTELADGDCVQ